MKRGNYTQNPHYFLAAYTFQSAWVLWAIRRAGLEDLKARAPCRDDVLEPETLNLLPRKVRLVDGARHPR